MPPLGHQWELRVFHNTAQLFDHLLVHAHDLGGDMLPLVVHFGQFVLGIQGDFLLLLNPRKGKGNQERFEVSAEKSRA